MEFNNGSASKECSRLGANFTFYHDATDDKTPEIIRDICSNMDTYDRIEVSESPITRIFDMDMEIQVGISLR